MQPPKCYICKKNFRSHPEEDFQLVRFEKSEAQIEKEEWSNDKDIVGHPANKVWFCSEHHDHAVAHCHMTAPEYYIVLSEMQEEE